MPLPKLPDSSATPRLLPSRLTRWAVGVGLCLAGATLYVLPRALTPPGVPVLPAAHAKPPLPVSSTTSTTSTTSTITDTHDAAHRNANEMGRVPILMYHSVGERGRYDKNGLNIAPATFRANLEAMHKAGFYPVNLRDLLDPHFSPPAGKTPVVITFDDARESQFRLKPDGTIDPTCAVGLMDAMHAKYGASWPQRATFFVLPRSQYNPTPFWQPGSEKKKVEYLVSAGYEVANHSTSHHPMRGMDAKRLTWESENCRAYFKHLSPGVTMDTLAVPYGIFPASKDGRKTLEQAGNRLIVKAWGDASVSPWDKRFDHLNVDRIGSEPGCIERWIVALKNTKNPRLARYISDGDPATLSVPPSYQKFAASQSIPGVQIVAASEPFPLVVKKAVTGGKHPKAKTHSASAGEATGAARKS